jgi:hypothetical protein
MGQLIPGEAIIYERANGVVYGRYRDPPHNTEPRWIVGGDPGAVAREQGDWLNWNEWQQLCAMAEEYPTIKKQLDKLIELYYIVKDGDTTSKRHISSD